MSSLRRTSRANEDLLDIWAYIAIEQETPERADYVLRELDSVANTLSENPLLGQKADQFRPGLRMFCKWNYILFYEPLDDGILVYRVLHGARSLEELF